MGLVGRGNDPDMLLSPSRSAQRVRTPGNRENFIFEKTANMNFWRNTVETVPFEISNSLKLCPSVFVANICRLRSVIGLSELQANHEGFQAYSANLSIVSFRGRAWT